MYYKQILRAFESKESKVTMTDISKANISSSARPRLVSSPNDRFSRNSCVRVPLRAKV